MNSPQEIQSQLQSIEQSLAETESLSTLWKMQAKSRKFEEIASGVDSDVHKYAIQVRTATREKLEGLIESGHKEELRKLVRQRKKKIENFLDQSFDEVSQQIGCQYRFRDEVLYLIRLLEKVQNHAPESPIQQIESEIEEMELFLEELRKKNGKTLEATFREKTITREALFVRLTDQFIKTIEKKFQSQLNSYQYWLFYDEVHKLYREGEWLLSSQHLDENRIQDIHEHLDSLEKAKNQILEKLSQEEREVREKVLESFFDYCSSLTAKVEDLHLPKAIHRLTNGRQQISEMEKLVEKEMSKDTRKKMKRFRKYFRNEEMEKKLQHRMEGIFGYTFVRLFENLILILIFAVLALLTVEFAWGSQLTKYQLELITWVDVAICFIFLVEFFGKMFLSPSKFLYFKNHFWFDFVPSIPFGLLEVGRTADWARAGRIARLGRLARILRYIRVARPLIRLARVFLLLFRVLDRLVKKYATLLNRNILVFTKDKPLNPSVEKSLIDDLHDFAVHLNRRIQSSLRALPLQEAGEILKRRLEQIDLLLEETTLGSGDYHLLEEEPEESSIREISLDKVIAELIHLDDMKINYYLGQETAETFARYATYFNLPILRSLPVLKEVVPYAKKDPPLVLTARAGRALGRFLEKIMGVIFFFSDFHGIVTPPQLLDRLGRIMINATQRPAKRLILFGAVFFIIQGFVHLLGLQMFEPAIDWLSKNLGLPIVILGGICAIPLVLGLWLTYIAGQASFFFERVAEAQYINLLKEFKYKNCQQDTSFLYYRTLDREHPQGKKNLDLDSFISRLKSTSDLHFESDDKDHEPWLEAHLVSLLYRDYIDGALLHSSDVKTSEQLLGNLTLDSIKRRKLHYSKKEIKNLDNLDLKEGGGFLGPYIWFNFITTSLAQRTARLVVDYNRNCIPKDDFDHVPDEEQRSMQSWLSRKRNLSPAEQREETLKKGQVPEGVYRTTEFTALHFLSPDIHRDRYVEKRFGTDVLEVLKEDREAIVRDVFGTYPLHSLPKSERTINPYELYQNYFAGGKIFFTPFYLVHLAFKGFLKLMKFLIDAVKDILHPDLAPRSYDEMRSGFGVAVRNINRMRQPIFMEALRMRCLFDHEYLGLPTPGYSLSLPSTYEDDLNFIGANSQEFRTFEQMAEKRSAKMVKFRQFLKDEHLTKKEFADYLSSIPNGEKMIPDQERILRALTIAYLVDYEKLSSLYESYHYLDDYFTRLLNNREKLENYSPRSPFFISGSKQKLFDNFWRIEYADRSKEEKARCFRAFLKNRKLQSKAGFLSKKGGREKMRKIVREVIQHWHLWNQELLSLRAVQTLSVLDVKNYRDVVYQLGDYSKDSPDLEEFQHEDLKEEGIVMEHFPSIEEIEEVEEKGDGGNFGQEDKS